ncbi:DUF1656 domain-containing protein [Trinickia caryophylli]|uniref:DUF1656 domain-containing protein n=1 Tax=Trinickia caryophylli TaxID=28094 RepID=A0A1X7E0W1_TRICW|nr:DUF1656 domain-containing protein [Trinickia caryophylli]PMS14057.1 DUF1656 domain-containing protein [Trinickia caryophylli]TRX17754.1 DUF1656 domain-containing protein [Trinickia caryophylli]WQE11482.1 DUF1656 domain-containing protein [Trinickia caryophylli]SMF25392.1 Protein of unknown function [Trinickia caryophylli]GLU32647.1 DUF1656 domain-containing protein [Trinickia caryophylli]
MPRDLAIFGAYVPAIVVLGIVGAVIAWAVDRLVAATGFYRFVWHPSLFRASLLVGICGALGLAVYR